MAKDIRDTEGPVRQSYLPQVLVATSVVAILPSCVAWVLRTKGVVDSYILSAVIAFALSLLGSFVGRAFWQKRPGSRNLLFGELMIWGYARRRWTEHRLDSARAVLGALSNAQSGLSGGLSPEKQVKLLEQFARRLDARDAKTYGHSRRVARYSWMIATRMNLGREEIARIRTAAAIHDIGKIETPDAILNKNGSLTDDEYATIKLHAADGARMSEVMHDEKLTAFVRHHHERLDGSGYPDHLVGEDIPIGSRIIAVADTFDALTANRSYRTARTHQQALGVLTEEAGTRLDADVVKAFCGHYSGRRGLTVWSGLSSLPARVFEQASAAAAGVGTAAKAIAVAAIAGGLATSGATLTHPSRGSGTAAGQTATAAGASSGAPAANESRSGSGTIAGTNTTADVSSPNLGIGAGAPGGSDSPASITTPAAKADAASGAGAGGSGSTGSTTTVTITKTGETSESLKRVSAGHGKASGPSGSSSSGGERPRSSSGATGSTGSGSGSGSAGGSVVEGVTGAVGKAGGKVTETTKGTVEAVKSKVEETKGKVEEVAKAKVEEAKTKVEEAKGKVEEVAKGKVEETKGAVEETVGKLKKIGGLAVQ